MGVSGLINAYRNAANNALNNAEIIEKLIENKYQLSFTYRELNEVMHILKQEKYNIISTNFQENCSLVFSVRKSVSEKAEKSFNAMHKVQIKAL